MARTTFGSREQDTRARRVDTDTVVRVARWDLLRIRPTIPVISSSTLSRPGPGIRRNVNKTTGRVRLRNLFRQKTVSFA